MNILTIIGARPQFIKAATISRAIAAHAAGLDANPSLPCIQEQIVHTGQHFDARMSTVFFEQLGIPEPDHHLGISGLAHGAMTGRMLEGLEALIERERPDWVLVYGDTNSTLAGALAAAKCGVPLAHVEAGLRSHNPNMPEEINRVLTDRVSTLLLCPTAGAVEELRREGFPYPAPGRRTQRIEQVGDVMLDAVRYYQALAREQVDLAQWGLVAGEFALATLHRQENTDDPRRLSGILQALRRLSAELPVVLPLHPRTRQRLVQQAGLAALDGLQVLEPLPYLEMQRLAMSARLILTDSGGLQKEAYFHQVPCLTLREETEWVETLETGWNRLVGTDPERILAAAAQPRPESTTQPALYGEGRAAEAVVRCLLEGDVAPLSA